MVPLCGLLLIAGFETTVNLVGNAVNALLDHPDQWAALVADPGRAGAAVQETLRFDPPVQRTARVSFDDTEVAGTEITRNRWVNVLLGGANRDPAVFADPDVFDIGRTDGVEHLAFSSGIHHCVGRPLAELEATVALVRLAERFPRLRRAGAVRRRNATLIRGPLVLPVAAG
nr:cytochrome P450 [Nocardioides sp. MAH-18]